MSTLNNLTERTSVPLLIAFADFTLFQKSSRKRSDGEVAEFLDGFYRLIAKKISESAGHVIKYMGDASLIVFEADRVDDGVIALLELKEDVDRWLPAKGWKGSQLIIKVHFGDVIAGPYGIEERLDVIGNAVNTTATLKSQGFALSVEAFRKLASETRKHFKKHTPPVTYIRTRDPHC